jgi:hypothetical protein
MLPVDNKQNEDEDNHAREEINIGDLTFKVIHYM